MTETTESRTPASAESGSRGSLGSLKLDELKRLAGSMGISGTSKMRKSDLLAAIQNRGDTVRPPAARSNTADKSADKSADKAVDAPAQDAPKAERAPKAAAAESDAPSRARAESAPVEGAKADSGHADSGHADSGHADSGKAESAEQSGRPNRESVPARDERDGGRDGGQEPADKQDGAHDKQDDRGERSEQRRDRGRQNNQNRQGGQGNQQGDRQQGGQGNQQGNQNNQGGNRRNQNQGGQQNQNNQGGQQGNQGGQGGGNRDDWDDGGRGNRRRQRGRDRKRGRNRAEEFGDVDTQVREDDVLVPVAGILDVLDNYAFVRTSGYLPGPNDVYVPLGIVKKNNMRKGDAVTGAVRALREGEQLPARQKFNALVRLDTINGMTPEQAGKRVEFGKLVPLYPQERLRLETAQNQLTTRIIDLVAPIGKGQRGLIVAPAKAGKTMVMQAVANAITTNNPECHLMVVLVDERPEEVTDMQRAVKGEVIASTFDRPADDHTTVAELAIERAKRLVEMGHDVVVLLDSITKLGRAYNLAAPASGRIMSGGVDSAALYPPKKFFGAARNIEDGGSLTILATALVETGSKMDEVIFEEFKGTGNMELKLDRQLANRRIFPAVDVNNSGTRREEILLGQDELKIMWKLRRVLAALDSQQSIELLLDRLKKTKSNVEFLMQVQQTSSIKLDDED